MEIRGYCYWVHSSPYFHQEKLQTPLWEIFVPTFLDIYKGISNPLSMEENNIINKSSMRFPFSIQRFNLFNLFNFKYSVDQT